MNIEDLQEIQKIGYNDQLIVQQSNNYTKQITYSNFLHDDRIKALYDTSLFNNLCSDITRINSSVINLSSNNIKLDKNIEEIQQFIANVDPATILNTLSTLSTNVNEIYGSISDQICSIITNLTALQNEISVLSNTTDIKTNIYIEDENKLLTDINYYMSADIHNLCAAAYGGKLYAVCSDVSVISTDNDSQEVTSYYISETETDGKNYINQTSALFTTLSTDIDWLSTQYDSLSTNIINLIATLNEGD